MLVGLITSSSVSNVVIVNAIHLDCARDTL